jgi:hypothetical protein
MKIEEVQKNVEGGIKGIGNFIKQNPFVAIIGIIVVFFLVFLFARPRRERVTPQPPAQPEVITKEVPVPKPIEVPVYKEIEKPIPMPIEVPVPKIIEKPIFIEPPVQPDPEPQDVYRDDIAWKEEFAAQLDAIQDALRVDRVEDVDPVIKIDPYMLDYYADPQRYVEEIMREDVFRPPRPRRNGLILTAAGEWEPVQDVIERQKQRYKDALARGDYKWADIVKRETEIALGHPVDW